MDYQEIADAVAKLEQKFNGEGRVLIRPSGTEPLVRVMIEGKDQKVIDEEAKKVSGTDYKDHALNIVYTINSLEGFTMVSQKVTIKIPTGRSFETGWNFIARRPCSLNHM